MNIGGSGSGFQAYSDSQNFQSQMGQVGTDVVKKLAEGADESYAYLRQQEKKQDTLGKSSQTTETTPDLSGLLNIASPTLTPPSGASGGVGATGAIGGSGALLNSPQYQAVMGAVLDSMVSNAQQSAEESQKANKKAQQEEVIKHNEQIVQQIKDDIRKQEMGLPPGYFNPQTMAPALIVMAGLTPVIAGGKIDPTDPSHIALSSVHNSVNASTQMIPDDMRAELGLLGAWMAGAAALQANALTIGKADNTESQQLTKDFAKHYGDRVLTMVNNKEFNAYLDTVIRARAPGEGAVTNEQVAEYKAALKVGLLVSAFALAYKADFGGMSGKEVMAMIANQRLEDAGANALLLNEIRNQMSALPPEQRAELVRQLTAFLDSKPPMDALMDPVKIFKGVTSASQQVQAQQATRTSV